MINRPLEHGKSGARGGVWLVLWWVMLLPVVCAQPLMPDEFNEGRRAYDAGFFDEAYLLWSPMAEAGDLRAQFAMGTLYFEGAGVSQDFALSTHWYRLAADQGLPAAQYNVGNSYRYGYGVDQSNVKAVHWWRLASEQGLASASFNIGTQYLYGRGVPRDEEEAYEWYRKAAKQGHPRAAGMFTVTGEIVRSEVAKASSASDSIADPAEPKNVPQPLVLQQPAPGIENDEAVLVVEQDEPESMSSPEVQQQPTPLVDSEPVNNAEQELVAATVTNSHQQPRTTPGVSASLDNAKKPVPEMPASVPLSKADAQQQSILYGSDWLLAQNPDHYTVQLAAMTEEARVSRFISRHQIKGELAYFRFERDGRAFFALVMGIYPDRRSASAAIARLPERVRAGTPWPRQIGGIRKLIEP